MNTPLRRRAGGEGEEEMEWNKMRSSKRYPNFEIFEDLKSEICLQANVKMFNINLDW